MNKIKILLLVFVLLGVSQVALAEDTSVVPPAMPEVVVPQVANEIVPAGLDKENRLEKIKIVGARLIADRVNELNKLANKIKKDKSAVAASSTLVARIETQKTSLVALGDQIKAGTEASSTKALVKTILTDYRIFAVFIPQVHYLRAIDTLTNHINNLTGKFVKVQTNIDAAKAKGQDVTARQASLDKAKTALVEVNASLVALRAKADGLKPADYPVTSKAVFVELKAGIKDVQVKIKTVRQSIWPSLIAKVKAEIKLENKVEKKEAKKIERENASTTGTTTGLSSPLKQKEEKKNGSPLMRLFGR